MTESGLIVELEQALAELPMFDVHTHLAGGRLGARGLHDILLYHMVVSDLYAAGCPSGARLTQFPDWPDVPEAHARLQEALPFLPQIRNTSCFWMVRTILRDLYNWHEPLDRRQLAAAGRRDPRAGGRPGLAARNLRPAAHPADLCGTRPAGDRPGRRPAAVLAGVGFLHPLPMGRVRHGVVRTGEMLGPPARAAFADRRHAAADGADHSHAGRRPRRRRALRGAIPYDQLVSTATGFSTDIDYRLVDDRAMAAALQRRATAGPAERDTYASYINEAYLTALEPYADRIVFQFSLGAEPLPYETGSILYQRTLRQLGELFARHPRIRFQCFLGSRHANQALCTLARELPNLSLAGYWWHNFFPDAIRQVLAERLEMLPLNKQIGFFSDAYCVEWVYGKALLVRKQLARVLADKIACGQYTLEDALAIARSILHDSPQTLLGMQPARSPAAKDAVRAISWRRRRFSLRESYCAFAERMATLIVFQRLTRADSTE